MRMSKLMWLLIAAQVTACSLPKTQPSPSDSAEVVPPAGATCMSTLDCGPDDVCIEQHCRQTKTSATAEILAAAAATQARQNQHAGAVSAYTAAVDAFRKHAVKVPSDVLCSLATASLRGATTREARELAAQHADRCLRASHPGSSERATVVHMLSEQRAEGLDPAHFDEQQPAVRYFTAEPDKPKLESVEIEIDLPERDAPGFSDLVAGVRTPEVRAMVSRCFIDDWERERHNRSEASLRIKFQSRMRDMGDYDSFQPSLEVTREIAPGSTLAPSGFADCVMRGVESALAPGPKLNRVVAWEERLHVVAHL